VHFLGRVGGPELRAWYGHALALIAPSLCFETFGMTLIEGFRAGVPVIARRIGPFPEIIDVSRGGGMLFDSARELEAAIRLLERDSAQRQAMGRAGCAAFRERWSEEAVVPRYLALIEALRAGRAGRSA
jgi:glycosyltransferase involved in cell wall biosynthesis